MIDRSDVAWSCLVDDTPEIWSSIVPWLATAIELARIEPSRIHVHHVCPLRPRLEELCHRLKINTRKTETFDLRFPHTNKIRQCATAFTDAKYVILTDVDVVFAGRPPLDKIRTPVAGKLVDEPICRWKSCGKYFRYPGCPLRGAIPTPIAAHRKRRRTSKHLRAITMAASWCSIALISRKSAKRGRIGHAGSSVASNS